MGVRQQMNYQEWLDDLDFDIKRTKAVITRKCNQLRSGEDMTIAQMLQLRKEIKCWRKIVDELENMKVSIMRMLANEKSLEEVK